MILSRLDAWLGKTLFHPPIILVCQFTRQTQYAVHRTLWFFAACHATYYAMADGGGWLWSAFLWLFVVAMFASAAFYPDHPARSVGWVRLFFWASFIIGALASATIGHVTDSTVRSLMILFAEYAATIKTIPPRQKRQRKASAGVAPL